MPVLPYNLSPTQTRLAGFIGISIALHLLTLVGTGRLDLAARRSGETPSRVELHATLAPPGAPAHGEPALPPPRDDTGAASETAQERAAAESAPPRPPAAAPAAEGTGVPLPAVDKWYVASEVDVRAQPTTDVKLSYPEHLRSEAIFGVVQLRLFIDERGVVRKMQVAASEPAGVFDEAAKRSWQDVRFSPAMKNGAPVKSQKLLELTYQPGLI